MPKEELFLILHPKNSRFTERWNFNTIMEEGKNDSIPRTGLAQRRLNFKKIFSYIFKIGLSVLAIYIISQKVEWQKVGFYLKQANWGFLLLAFLAFFISKSIAALRTNCYYRTQQLFLSETLNLKLSLLAIFYNLFIPMIGGEGYKVYWLNRNYNMTVKSMAWASLLDRVSGLLALLCLAVLFLQFTNFPGTFKAYFLLGIPLIYLISFIVHRLFFNSFIAAWWKVNGYSIIVQSLQVTCTFFILLALNVDSHFIEYLFIFLLASMAFVLPFIGAREMAFVFGASYLGLDADLSLTISIFFYLSMVVTSLSGLFFFMFPAFLKVEKREVILEKV